MCGKLPDSTEVKAVCNGCKRKIKDILDVLENVKGFVLKSLLSAKRSVFRVSKVSKNTPRLDGSSNTKVYYNFIYLNQHIMKNDNALEILGNYKDFLSNDFDPVVFMDEKNMVDALEIDNIEQVGIKSLKIFSNGEEQKNKHNR